MRPLRSEMQILLRVKYARQLCDSSKPFQKARSIQNEKGDGVERHTIINYKEFIRYMINYNGAKWEMGQCTDKEVIYFLLKGRNDKRYAHFHISKKEARMIANDLLQASVNDVDNIRH